MSGMVEWWNTGMVHWQQFSVPYIPNSMLMNTHSKVYWCGTLMMACKDI